MKKYFIHNGTENEGPLDMEQLKEKGITRSTPIWYEGLPNWTSAREIAELQSLLAALPPPMVKRSRRRVKPKKETPLLWKTLQIMGWIVLMIIIFIVLNNYLEKL